VSNQRDVATYRAWRTRGVGDAFAAWMGLVLLVGISDVAASVELGLFFIIVSLIGLFWALFFVRRSGVYVTADGITNRGAVSVRRVSWRDISGFAVLGRKGIVVDFFDPARVRGYVVLHDGSKIALTGLRPALRQRASQTREDLSRTIGDLQRLLVARNGN